MKTAIILVVLGLLTGVGSIKTIDAGINSHIAATNKANGMMADVQMIQGGEDNTDYMLQATDQPVYGILNPQQVVIDNDQTDLQPAAGYEALNWRLQ